eukprot:TRINITY_DN2541_c0_g1_i2.p1 TRINITY_DN2541_c0_g1~~TRINITY_DN2541_c0_g1_i2.p1  ORF type:complete len:778 (-),score=148.32 TRINITY_DN2541_c0_g1_i2:13-2265(-)
MPSVQFRVKCVTQHSEEVKVVGDRALTGFWDPAVSELGLRTDERAYPWWEGSCEVPEGERWELKFVASGPTGVRWEGCANRVLLPGGEAARYEARFDEPGATLTPLSGDMAVGSSQPAYRPPAVPEDSELLDDNGDEAGSPASPPAPAARTPIPRNPQRGLRSLTERNVRQLAASLERSEAQQASSSTDEPNQLTPRLQFPQAQMSRRTLSSSSFSGSVRGDAGVVQMVRLLSESMSPDVGPPDPEEPQEPDWNIGGERNGGSEEALSGDSDPALVLTSSRGASKPSTAAEEPALDGQSGSQTKAVAQNEQGGAPRKRRCADGCLCKLLSRICCCFCGVKGTKRGERVGSQAARNGESELASTQNGDKPSTAVEEISLEECPPNAATQSNLSEEKGGTSRKRRCTDCCLCKLLCCSCCSCCDAKGAKRGGRAGSEAAQSPQSLTSTADASSAAEELSPKDAPQSNQSREQGGASRKRRCTDCCLCKLLSRVCCCCCCCSCLCGAKEAKRGGCVGSEAARSGDSEPALADASKCAEDATQNNPSLEQGGAPRKRKCTDCCLCKLLSRICCCCCCSCLCGAKEAKRGERVSSEAARSGDSELAQVPTSPSTLDADKPPTAAEDATQSASGGEKGGTPRKRKCTDCCLCKLLSRICCCCCCSCLCGAKEAKRGERVSSGAARSGESKLAEVPTSSSTLDTSKPSTAAEEMSPEDPSKKNGDASGKRRCTDCCLCRLLSRACCCCCGVKGAKRS